MLRDMRFNNAYNCADLLEAEAATIIQACWRSFSHCSTYTLLLEGKHKLTYRYSKGSGYVLTSTIDITRCQSIVRRQIAVNRVHEMRFQQQHTETLIKIMSNMEHVKAIEKMSAIVITSLLKRWTCERNFLKARSGTI